MDLTCDDCRAIIQIADARVPPNSAFRLTCPRCQRRIAVTTKPPEKQGGGKIAVSTAVGFDEVLSPRRDKPREGFAEEMDSLQPGRSAALLCLDRDHACEVLKAVLEGMGYAVDMPGGIDLALQQLRLNQYRIILLAEHFGGNSPNPVAAYLAGLNMNIRREMFVVLVGERFKTADHLQAFIESANLVLHPDDLLHIETFLSRGLRDHDRFYKVFIDCLIEAGKKL